VTAELIISDSLLSDVGLVIFDKDGTLIDVHTYWANMVRLRVESLNRQLDLTGQHFVGLMESMGADARNMRVKPTGPVGIEPREVVLQAGADYLAANGYGHQTSALLQAFAEADTLSETRLHDFIKPIAGLSALLDSLRACQCRIAVATTDRTDRAILTLRHLEISGLIDLVAGADSVHAAKPAPDIVRLICDRLHVPVNHTVIVGDSVADVRTGMNAGCLASVGVTSGLTDARALRQVTPLVVPSIANIHVACPLSASD